MVLIYQIFFIFASLINDCPGNVLFIIGDDMGFDTSAYYNDIIDTPNIQIIAETGIVFDNAYTSVSSCSPSRASILTGLPQHQNGMYGLHHNYHHFNCFEGLQSLPMILRQNGIFTGIIGKKHVGPSPVFDFDFEETEEKHSIMQVGRNITFIKLMTQQFFREFHHHQVVSYHDPHRCSHSHPEFGPFCERFGDGSPVKGSKGRNLIPDWKPMIYGKDRVKVPYFVPDTPASRADLAAQYTAINRMDQGIGLVMAELTNGGGLTNDTMILFTSDNGIPFPNGRTNAYQPGLKVPLLLALPPSGLRRPPPRIDDPVTISEDILPSILDWFGIPKPGPYEVLPGLVASLRGKSFIPKAHFEIGDNSVGNMIEDRDGLSVFGSQSLHEITGYYPMRSVIEPGGLKLIHNLNYGMPFPIDQDFYASPTFQDMLNRTRSNATLNWNKSLRQYYHRLEWELFDLKTDPAELVNLFPSVPGDPELESAFQRLKDGLRVWQNQTNDPWLCAPDQIMMQGSGRVRKCERL